MRAQQPVAQPVEGAEPHAADIGGKHRPQAHRHLLRRLVGEGHGENARGARVAGLDQPGDAGGEDAGLAAAGTGEDQRMLVGQGDGGELMFVEIVK